MRQIQRVGSTTCRGALIFGFLDDILQLRRALWVET
jgi:hypothetical protein